jgi:hypothetical protein
VVCRCSVSQASSKLLLEDGSIYDNVDLDDLARPSEEELAASPWLVEPRLGRYDVHNEVEGVTGWVAFALATCCSTCFTLHSALGSAHCSHLVAASYPR